MDCFRNRGRKARRKKTQYGDRFVSFPNLSVEEHLVVRHRLLLVHSEDRTEVPRRFSLENVDDVAVRPPVQGEVLDQAVLGRFHLNRYA